MATHPNVKQESTVGTILGWGSLAVFSIAFAWHVGKQLIMRERWADKKNDAIELVKNSKPIGNETLYDIIRAYSLKAKEQDVYVGEFSWDAMQREGPEYEVTLLWTERSERKVAVWRVNLQTREIRPQGNEASGLPKRMAAGVPPAAQCRFNLLARIGSVNWRLVGTGVWKYALAEEIVGRH